MKYRALLFLAFFFILSSIFILIRSFALKHEFRFSYEKLKYPEIIKSEEEAIKEIEKIRKKIIKPKRFRILKKEDYLSSKYLEEILSIEELLKSPVFKKKKITITPERYRRSLIEEEKWKPPLLPEGRKVEEAIGIKMEEQEVHLVIYGRQKLSLSYGWSHFLKKPEYAEARAYSQTVHRGLKAHQSLEIHIRGRVGKKVQIHIDSSGREKVDKYEVTYNALRKEEFIQKISAGNIGVSLPGSTFVAGGGASMSAFGIKVDAKKKDFKFQAIASMTRGITEVKKFKGLSSLVVKNIRDIDYIKRKYYIINNGQPVQKGSVVIYLDDENGDNNFGTTPIVFKKGTNVIETNDCNLLYNGVDYIIDYNKSLIIFKRNISPSHDILITYNQPDGSNQPYIPTGSIDTDYKIMMTNQYDNKKYVFLQRKNTVSPYEYKGVYYIGNANIKKEDKDFKFYIMDKSYNKLEPQPFTEISSEEYGLSGTGYYIDEVNGYIIFSSSEPFNFPGSYYQQHPDKSIYGYNPLSEYSYYYLHIEYRYQTTRFQLRWNIVPNSEKVFIDGRKLTRNVDYTIDYDTGELQFRRDRVTITPESEIEVVYEYLPWGGGLQQILAGLRVDYDPGKWYTFGGIGLYNGRQAPGRVPSPNSASDNRWVGAVFGKATLDEGRITKAVNTISPVKFKKIPVSLNASGELAGSYYNINTFGQAMIDDFEGTVETLGFSIHERDWYFTSSPGGHSTMGKLYYKDYRDYDEDRLMPLDWVGAVNVDFSVKPGPYNADEGHLSPEQLEKPDQVQRSLVLDYDFSGGKNWVGVIYKNGFGGGGRDFRHYNTLIMWVKLESSDPDAAVKLRVDIGRLKEDLDGDGILDEETSKFENGFPFNNPDGSVLTKIGGAGYYVDEDGDGVKEFYLKSNGRLDSEDLDRDGYLYTGMEEVISFPSIEGYAKTEDGNTELIIKKSEGWRQVRITLNQDLLSEDKRELLKRIKNIRIVLEKYIGDTGKLVINQIYFSGLSWREVKLNDTPVTSTNADYFKVYTVSTFDNADYNENALWRYAEDEFEDLHGPMTDEEHEEDNEQALAIAYNLSRHNFNLSAYSNYLQSGKYTCGYVIKNFSSSFDMRYYQKIKVWVYVKNLPNNRKGEYFFIRFGTPDNYYEYRRKIDWTGWKRVEVDLRSDEFKNLNPVEGVEQKYASPSSHFRVVGVPNLKLVNQIALGVYGSETADNVSGVIWINDLYLDEVEKISDYAYLVNLNGQIKNHLSVNYSMQYRGKDFSSVGALGTGTESKSYNLGISWNSLNWLPVNFNYSKSYSLSDIDELYLPVNQQGHSISYKYSGNLSLNTPQMPILKNTYPQYLWNINLNGSYTLSSNKKPLGWLPVKSLEDYLLTQFSKSWAWGVATGSKLPFFDTYLDTHITYNGSYAMSYSETKNINYTKATTNETGYSALTNYKFSKTKNLSLNGNINTHRFSLSPSYTWRIALSKNSIRTDAWDIVSRNRNLRTGLTTPQIFSLRPSFNWSFTYNESGFHYISPGRTRFDEDFDEDKNLFKNASTSQSFSLSVGSIPLNFLIFETLTPNYSKSMGLTQNNISAYSNRMSTVMSEIVAPFLLRIPGYYMYIPYIYPKYKSFDFVRLYHDKSYSSSISLRNTFSLWLRIKLAEWSVWNVSTSLNQNTSRSYSSYNFTRSINLSASSSLELMRFLSDFWIFKQNPKEYKKSFAVSWNLNYRRDYNYLQKSYNYSFSPSFSFTYRWKPDKSISWNFSYRYNVSAFSNFTEFYKAIEEEYGEEFRNQIEPNPTPFPDKVDITYSASTGYSFSSKLPEKWKPPLFFKKPVKLGFTMNHSFILSFLRHTYDYGQDSAGNDYIHPKEMVRQFVLTYNYSFQLRKNIDGGGHMKLAYEKTREERGKPGDENDDEQEVISWEIGINVSIKF